MTQLPSVNELLSTTIAYNNKPSLVSTGSVSSMSSSSTHFTASITPRSSVGSLPSIINHNSLYATKPSNGFSQPAKTSAIFSQPAPQSRRQTDPSIASYPTPPSSSHSDYFSYQQVPYQQHTHKLPSQAHSPIYPSHSTGNSPIMSNHSPTHQSLPMVPMLPTPTGLVPGANGQLYEAIMVPVNPSNYSYQMAGYYQQFANGAIPMDSNNTLLNKRKIIKRRTRTGCLTCRKRRIKCDERKPFCSNCEKSKKMCCGYEDLSQLKKNKKSRTPQ